MYTYTNNKPQTQQFNKNANTNIYKHIYFFREKKRVKFNSKNEDR